MSIFDRWFNKQNNSPMAERMNGEEQNREGRIFEPLLSAEDAPNVFFDIENDPETERTETEAAPGDQPEIIPWSASQGNQQISGSPRYFAESQPDRDDEVQTTLRSEGIDTSNLTSGEIQTLAEWITQERAIFFTENPGSTDSDARSFAKKLLQRAIQDISEKK